MTDTATATAPGTSLAERLADALRDTLRRELDAREWSLRELGRQAGGLSHSVLSQFMSGKHNKLDLDTLARIAPPLGMDVPALLGAAAAGRSVPLDRLFLSPLNVRHGDLDAGDIDGLAASIAAQGVLQPLIVRPRGDLADDFEVIAGQRRHRALQLLRRQGKVARDVAVPVVLFTGDDDDAVLASLIENLQRHDMHPLQEGEAFLAYEERHPNGATARLAEQLGVSQRYVQKRMALASKLVERVQDAFREGFITITHANWLATMDGNQQLGTLAGWRVAGEAPSMDARRDEDRNDGKVKAAITAPPSRAPAEEPEDEPVDAPLPLGDFGRPAIYGATEIIELFRDAEVGRHKCQVAIGVRNGTDAKGRAVWLGGYTFQMKVGEPNSIYKPIRNDGYDKSWPTRYDALAELRTMAAEWAIEHAQQPGEGRNHAQQRDLGRRAFDAIVDGLRSEVAAELRQRLDSFQMPQPATPQHPSATADGDDRQSPLTVAVEGDRLVISMGITTLPMVVKHHPALYVPHPTGAGRGSHRVTDPATFAEHVVWELEREEEDGTTLVHEMFDRAIERAIENGAEGVDLTDEENDDA